MKNTINYVLKDLAGNEYKILKDSLVITKELSTVGSISLRLKLLNKLNLKRYDYVTIYDKINNVIVQDGLILNVKQAKKFGFYEVEVEIETGERILKNEIINYNFNINNTTDFSLTLGAFITYINNNLSYINSIVLYDSSLSSTVLEVTDYDNVLLIDVLNDIVDLISGYWVLKNKTVYINTISTGVSKATFYDYDVLDRSVVITDNSDRYINSVYFTDAFTTKSFTYQKPGDSNTRIYKLDYAIYGVPKVFVMRDYLSSGATWVEETVEIYQYQDEGLADWYFEPFDFSLTQNSNKDVLLNADRIKVLYTGLIPYNKIVDVGTEVSDVLLRSNGLAAREVLTYDMRVVGLNNINSIASKLVNAYKNNSTEVTVTVTDIKGCTVGDTVTCSFDYSGVFGDYVLKRVETSTRQDVLIYDLVLSSGTLRLSLNDGVKEEVKKLVKSNNKVSTATNTLASTSDVINSTTENFSIIEVVREVLNEQAVLAKPVGSVWVYEP